VNSRSLAGAQPIAHEAEALGASVVGAAR